MTLQARVALLAGSRHHNNFTNRQDMCHFNLIKNGSDGLEAVFIGCDGCSGSESSEIGAGLTAYFAAETLTDMIRAECIKDELSARQTLDELYREIIHYLHSLIAIQPHGQTYLDLLAKEADGQDFIIEDHPHMHQVYRWIGNHLLFTIVGAYFGTTFTVAFQRGDGGYQVDDVLHTEDHKNIPPYLAYHFFPKNKLDAAEKHLAETRHIHTHLPPEGFTMNFYPGAKRLAVFSDGMPAAHIDEVWALTDPYDQWEFRRNQLQKAARKWHRDSELHDDLFLGVFVRED